MTNVASVALRHPLQEIGSHINELDFDGAAELLDNLIKANAG